MAKSKRKSRQHRSKQAASSVATDRPLLIERLADAALILGLFSVFAFSEIRFEGFETEKAAMMPIFGGIILAAHLARLFRHRDIKWKQFLLNPLVIGVIGIIITSGISTTLSLSPARSWIGEAERLSGLQTLLMYLLLFSQAVVSVERLTPMLTPIIITIAAPLCLSVLFAAAGGQYRPGSTTGNPNYLSSWLVMSMLMLIILLFIRLRKLTGEWNWVLLPQLLFTPALPMIMIPTICLTIYNRVKDVPYGWKKLDWAYLLLILFMLVFMTGTIVVVGSRAALLSYAIGGMTAVSIILAVAHQRRLLLIFAGSVIIAGATYVTISNVIPAEIKAQGGIYRVLNLGDSRRQELWGGAISVIKQQSQPFYLADGTPDPLASLRPVVGYGLSVIPQTQGRFGATTHKNQFVGSFHNHIFDYIVMTGYPGMLFYVLFYLGTIGMTLNQLRLLRGDTFQWLMVLLMFGLIGVLVTPSLFPGADFLNVVPIGLTLGVLGGNFVWIAGQAFRKADYEKAKTDDAEDDISPYRITDRQILLAGLLGVMILRWVDIQFAFVQAASEPLFWCLAGLFLGHYYKLKFGSQETTDETSDEIQDARPMDWQMGVLGTGVMIFYGFGVTVQSQIYNHQIGVERIPFFILLLLIVGYGGVFLVKNALRNSHPVSLPVMMATPAIWFVMWAVKSSLSTSAGYAFENALNPQIISISTLFSSFFQLSLNGIVMVIIMLVIWTLFDNWQVKLEYPIAIVAAMVLAIVGMVYYSNDYVAATTHKMGIGFMEEGAKSSEERYFAIAEAPFQIATSLDPTNARLRIHYMGMLTQHNSVIPNSRPDFENEINHNTELLLQYEPYFIHTLEWKQFSDFHERIFGRPFMEIAPVAVDN